MTVVELKRKQAKRRRARRRRGILGTIFFLLGIVIIWAILCGMNHEVKAVGYDYKSGSSLWDLACECPNSIDKRDYIAEIMALNAMDSNTVYADRLYQVPIYKD